MPCTVTGSLEGDAQLAASEVRKEATATTKLLCKACKLLDQFPDMKIPVDLQKWWLKHKDVDRREYETRIRNTALAKLSLEEKRILKL